MKGQFDLSKYEDFTGVLVKVRRHILRPDRATVTLKNDLKAIRVFLGHPTMLEPGQTVTVGHIGTQVINIRPHTNKPYGKASCRCPLQGRTVTASECTEIQEMRRKPGECAELPFSLAQAEMLCPKCPYRQTQ